MSSKITITSKVILLGINNPNGLGIVRTLGSACIKPYGIIMSNDKQFLPLSKYWERVDVVETVDELLELLMKLYGKEFQSGSKPIVIPYNDKVIQALDGKLDYYSQFFILPSFNKEQGKILGLASKFAQTEFAESIGLQMLPTKIVSIPCEPPEDYPVILKAVAGGEAYKDDIRICGDRKAFEAAMTYLQKKQYTRFLMQPYLEERTEYVAYGAICPEGDLVSYTVIRNLRQWPDKHGVGCYSEYVTSGPVVEFVDNVFKTLLKAGYDSPIDIEIFEDKNGKLFINEFNWRVGGRNYTALDTGVKSVLWWLMCKVGQKPPMDKLINTKRGTTMKETVDFYHVMGKQISLFKWLKDLFGSSSLEIWDWGDIRPAWNRYWLYISHKLGLKH